MILYTLSQSEQDGSFNLNNREINFEIKRNGDFGNYHISLFENDEMVLGGRNLVNGCDLLYNMKLLDLGKSLTFYGEQDLSEAYLVYEE